MSTRHALIAAAISLGVATGASAQTYAAPGGSPTATAPGGHEGRWSPEAAGRHDDLTTGTLSSRRPATRDALGSLDPAADAMPVEPRSNRRAR